MNNQHIWLARVGVVLFLLMLFVPSSAISGGGRGFGLFVAAALCAAYAYKEVTVFLKGKEQSWAELLPKVAAPALVILLTPVFAWLR